MSSLFSHLLLMLTMHSDKMYMEPSFSLRLLSSYAFLHVRVRTEKLIFLLTFPYEITSCIKRQHTT